MVPEIKKETAFAGQARHAPHGSQGHHTGASRLSAPVFDALRFQAASFDVIAASHAPPSLLAQRQTSRLERLLQAAQQGSAFYRERLPATPVAADFARVQPVTRDELMQRFADWVTDPALQLDELRGFTAGLARVGEGFKGYMAWESSGTSGRPGMFVQDAATLAVYDALEAVRHRVRAPHGLFNPYTAAGLGERTALVTATQGHFASIVSFERLRRINRWFGQTSASFDIQQPLGDLCRQLQAFGPTIVATYPTAATLLAERQQAGALAIHPHHVVTGGESLGGGARALIGSALGTTVRASYGASEFLPIAWECGHGQLHVNSDWVILEPVDEKLRPVPPGELSHSVLLTNLANLVQPVIRYDLGDQVTLQPGRCACGSALPVIEVLGRRDDILRVPAAGGRGGDVALLPLALSTVIEEQGGVFDFQLQQRGPRSLVLRIANAGVEGHAAMARCKQALAAYLEAQGAAPVRVHGEIGCHLPRGRSGKACRMMFG